MYRRDRAHAAACGAAQEHVPYGLVAEFTGDGKFLGLSTADDVAGVDAWTSPRTLWPRSSSPELPISMAEMDASYDKLASDLYNIGYAGALSWSLTDPTFPGRPTRRP